MINCWTTATWTKRQGLGKYCKEVAELVDGQQPCHHRCQNEIACMLLYKWCMMYSSRWETAPKYLIYFRNRKNKFTNEFTQVFFCQIMTTAVNLTSVPKWTKKALQPDTVYELTKTKAELVCKMKKNQSSSMWCPFSNYSTVELVKSMSIPEILRPMFSTRGCYDMNQNHGHNPRLLVQLKAEQK